MGVMTPSDAERTEERPQDFATTRWSVVLAAGRGASPQASAALEDLCQIYWYPLYVYVRRRGYTGDAAADLTQEFFARLLEKNRLAQVDRRKGKFRSFLLASMKHFLANEWDKSQARKRGGGRETFSIELSQAEAAYRFEPVDEMTAERAFERRWALTLLDSVLHQLRMEYVAGGKKDLFDRIKGKLTHRDGAGSYREIAADLKMSEGAV